MSLNQECLTRPLILFHGLYPHFLHKICVIDSSVPLWSQKWWLESKFSLNLYFSISSLSRRQYYWHEHPGDCILYISKLLHWEKKTSNLYFAYIKIFKDILISSTMLFFNVKSFRITRSWLEYELKQSFWCISRLLITEWSEILTCFNSSTGVSWYGKMQTLILWYWSQFTAARYSFPTICSTKNYMLTFLIFKLLSNVSSCPRCLWILFLLQLIICVGFCCIFQFLTFST